MDNSVTISTERYDELLDIETRVNVVVEIIERDGYLNTESLLRTFGTEYAVEVADRIQRKDEEMSFEEMLED